MLRIDREQQLNLDTIRRLVQNHIQMEVPRLLKLENYYKGKSAILQREMADKTKPNNKISNPFANYITTNLTGYFMGKPVTYNSQNDKALEELMLTFTYNDEQDENAELATSQSIYGVAYEMIYTDKDGATRFKIVNPKEIITLYDNTIEADLVYVIRYYPTEDIVTEEKGYRVELYSDKEIIVYKANEQISELQQVENKPHFFSLVPFIEYKNNEDLIGDFEEVIPLIDAYDTSTSDTLNTQEYFADAYMIMKGVVVEPEDIQAMKERRVIDIPDGDAEISYLTKESNDTELENTKVRLEKDIHKFSKCPNLSDENFSGNSSGVAMAYKLMGTENVAAIKERKFKRGLQRRLELLQNIGEIKGSNFDWRAIEIVFSRNLPVNVTEDAEIAVKLKGIVSNETILSNLSIVEDVTAELERLEKEKEANPFYDTLPNMNQVGQAINE